MKMNHRTLIASAFVVMVLPAQAATYGGTAIVATSGGDYADPAAALADVATWCGTPAETNRCQIKLMPGNYNVASTLVMQEWVDVVGSGENSSALEGEGMGSALISIASNSQLSDLNVKVGPDGYGPHRRAVAFQNYNENGVMRRVRIDMSGRVWSNSYAVTYGRGDPEMEDVEINQDTNSWSTGVIGSYGNIHMRNVKVYMTGPSTNIGVDSAYGNFYADNSVFESTGAASNEGIRLRQSNGHFQDVRAIAKNGTHGKGIFVSSGHNGNGYFQRVTAYGQGSNTGYGVYNKAGYSTTHITSSWVHGTTNSVYTNFGNTTTKIASTMLTGSVHNQAGTTTCAGVVDRTTNSFYASTCP